MSRTADKVARYLNEQQRKLYELVWKRAVASQMQSAELDQTIVALVEPTGKTKLRANGSVISARQKSSGWLLGGGSLEGTSAEPGDTIFVPEELNKTTFIQEAKDWTQILYQFGIGAAALKTFKN